MILETGEHTVEQAEVHELRDVVGCEIVFLALQNQVDLFGEHGRSHRHHILVALDPIDPTEVNRSRIVNEGDLVARHIQ